MRPPNEIELLAEDYLDHAKKIVDHGSGYSVATATLAGAMLISESLRRMSESLDKLGLNNAHTPLGAIEMLAEEVRNGMAAIANTLDREDS